MSAGIIIIDTRGNDMLLNSPARKMLGFSAEDKLENGKVYEKIAIAGLDKLIEDCRKEGRPGTKEIARLDSANGFLSCGVFPLEDNQGQINMIAVILRDISEEKETEKMKTDFISNVSHEVRTPLSIAHQGISLLLDSIPGRINKKQEQVLTVTRNNIDRLAHIIENLLDISKIEAGRLGLRRKLVSLGDLIREVIISFEAKAREKGLDLRINLPEEEVSAYIDSQRIRRVFNNLIGNAIKFTRDGFVEIFAVKKEDGQIQCVVSDTGVGISSDNLENIFSKFHQLKRVPGPGEEGTGLGLPIAKGIIELHGGKIWAESEPARGSKFIFTIPSCSSETFFKDYIKDKIGEALRSGKGLSLFVVSTANLDRLKAEIGEDKISSLILELEALVKNNLRPDDTLFRNKDEILLILPDCGKEESRRIRERLEQALEYYFVCQKINGNLKISLGYATYPDDATDEEGLMGKARKVEEARIMAKKILLIEDEPDQIIVMRMELESSGYKVISAIDGEEGLKKVKQEKPDLILLDLIIPKIGGFEVCRRLRQEGETKDIPVIVITVTGVIEAREKSLAAGANDYIQKPYDPKELIAKIKSLIKN